MNAFGTYSSFTNATQSENIPDAIFTSEGIVSNVQKIPIEFDHEDA